MPVILCGNKVDLREAYYRGSSCVSAEEGAKLGKQNYIGFIETSPKTGYNVHEALIVLAKLVNFVGFIVACLVSKYIMDILMVNLPIFYWFREMSLAEDEEVRNCLKLVEPLEKKRSCCGGTSNTPTSGNS